MLVDRVRNLWFIEFVLFENDLRCLCDRMTLFYSFSWNGKVRKKSSVQ